MQNLLLDQGNTAHLELDPYYIKNIFYLRKFEILSFFWKIHLKSTSKKLFWARIFCQVLLWVSLENFLHSLYSCSGYVKPSPRSGEHSAFWIRPIRRFNQFILKQKRNFWILLKISSQKANSALEYSTLFGEFLTLRASKKFSTKLENMFWVCKTFP